MQPSVLMLARFAAGSTNISQAHGFRNNGWRVIEYDFVDRLRSLGSTDSRDQEIVETCKQEVPDLVFISKGAGISTDCIIALNHFSHTLLWYMDPLDDNWNDELLEKIEECHVVTCGLFRAFEEAKKINPNTYFVHEGFDSACDYPHLTDKVWDVSFIGQTKGLRAIYHVALGFKVINNAYGVAHALAVGKSKINLNFVVNNSGCSDRVYKILAAEGFLLTEDWPGRSLYFKDGRDLVVFDSLQDLQSKITYYLRNSKERELIAHSGLEKVQQFTRTDFARVVIECAQLDARG